MTSRSALGELEQLVLLAVARLDRSGYGVSIQREIRARVGRRVSLGAVYATLGRLEAKGYVASRQGDPTPARGGRAKRCFMLRPAGARALQAGRRSLDQMWEGLVLEPDRGSA